MGTKAAGGGDEGSFLRERALILSVMMWASVVLPGECVSREMSESERFDGRKGYVPEPGMPPIPITALEEVLAMVFLSICFHGNNGKGLYIGGRDAL